MRITLASRGNVQLLSTKGEVFQGPPDRATSIKYTSLKRRGFVPRGPPSSNGPSGSFCSRAKDVSIFAVTTNGNTGALSLRRSFISNERKRFEACVAWPAERSVSHQHSVIVSNIGTQRRTAVRSQSRSLSESETRRSKIGEVVAPRSPVARSLTSGRKAENLLLWN